jgi:hypothetical protein
LKKKFVVLFLLKPFLLPCFEIEQQVAGGSNRKAEDL